MSGKSRYELNPLKHKLSIRAWLTNRQTNVVSYLLCALFIRTPKMQLKKSVRMLRLPPVLNLEK